MQNLYNELTSSISEFKDDGEVTYRPPTVLMLRAAKAIEKLVGINASNMTIIHSLQLRVQENIEELEVLRKELSDGKILETNSSSDAIITTLEPSEDTGT